MPTAPVDCVVVGAGVAGLAAAAELRRLGRSCLLLEAGSRIGGRAWTTHPPALGGAVFDHGASWLHQAEGNPLVSIARAAGDPLRSADSLREWRTYVGSRPADAEELAAYDRAEATLRAALAERAEGAQADVSLAEAAASFAADPWTRTVLAWEGLIAAADPGCLSLRDWHLNSLAGGNLLVEGGLGHFVAARLGAAAGPVRLATPVQRISWQEPGGTVTIGTPHGDITAGSCIVTVSTGVLAGGGIVFTPALPAPVEEAVHALPMGLLTKVALRATGPDRLDLPASCAVDRQVGPGETLMSLHFWPGGADHVVGFVAGATAWDLAREGDAAPAAFCRDTLRTLFGARADRLFAGDAAVVTGWGLDPLTRGSYCYAVPGQAAARSLLAQPLADGRLVFAGEACHSRLGGTVGGAYLSGKAAVGLSCANAPARPGVGCPG